MPNTVTLHCSAGHDWQRLSQRGRRPLWCPEHRPVTPEPVAATAKPERPGMTTARAKFIALCESGLEGMQNEECERAIRFLLKTAQRGRGAFGCAIEDDWYTYHTDSVKIHTRQGRRR
jgi:hypothetical protein